MATLLELKELFEAMPDDKATLELKLEGKWASTPTYPSVISKIENWRWKPGPVHPSKELRIELSAEWPVASGPAVLTVKLFKEDVLLPVNSVTTDF